MSTKLAACVWYCGDIDATMVFYQTLGWVFAKEQHGMSPVHYSSEINGWILELYPCSPQNPVTHVRLEVKVSDFYTVIQDLYNNGFINLEKLAESKLTKHCLVSDPDGRKIIITSL